MILRMHGGRAIASIESNPCLRARIRNVFYKASGNRAGSEFSLLESTFGEAGHTESITSGGSEAESSRDRETEGGLLHGTGYEARLHAVHTAKLVSVALGRHAHSRTHFLRLLRKIRRKVRHREMLVPTIQIEQRNTLRFLYYSMKVNERGRRCQIMSLRRPMKNWRVAVVAQWTRKSLARFCMRHISAANKELKEARNWLRPFVESVAIRKQKSAFKHWLSKQEFLMTLHDKAKVDLHMKLMKKVLVRIQALQKAKRHYELVVLRACFASMEAWVEMSLVEDRTRRAIRKWQWRNFRSIESRNTTKEDMHLHHGMLRRGLAALGGLIEAPSLRFKKTFIMAAMKLSSSPVYSEYYRDKVIQRMRGELNRFRQADVSKGQLLKCLSNKVSVWLQCINPGWHINQTRIGIIYHGGGGMHHDHDSTVVRADSRLSLTLL